MFICMHGFASNSDVPMNLCKSPHVLFRFGMLDLGENGICVQDSLEISFGRFHVKLHTFSRNVNLQVIILD